MSDVYYVCGVCDEAMRHGRVHMHYRQYHPELSMYDYKKWPDGTIVSYTEASPEELEDDSGKPG